MSHLKNYEYLLKENNFNYDEIHKKAVNSLDKFQSNKQKAKMTGLKNIQAKIASFLNKSQNSDDINLYGEVSSIYSELLSKFNNSMIYIGPSVGLNDDHTLNEDNPTIDLTTIEGVNNYIHIVDVNDNSYKLTDLPLDIHNEILKRLNHNISSGQLENILPQ